MNTVRSAQLLRDFLGPITLEPVLADTGRPYYRAWTPIDALVLVESPNSEAGASGSNSLRTWALSQRI